MKKVTSFFASSVRTVFVCTVIAWLSVFNTASAQCSQPSNLNVVNLSPTSVEFSWSAAGSANNYKLQYRANGAATWTSVTAIQGTSYTLTGLSQSTVYRWRVKANCSTYSSIAFFNTGGGGNNTSCSQPSNLTAVGTSSTSAILGWSASPGAFSYTVQYRIQGVGAYTSITFVQGLSVSITGLVSGVTYEFRVKSSCSDYSSIALFTTNSTGGGGTTCSAPSNTNTVSVTDTTANVAWEAVNTATSYLVEYRLENAVSYTTVGTFTTANANITGLMPNKQYVWRVKASCSPYGSDVQFSTPANKVANSNSAPANKLSALDQNSIKMSVTPNPANDGFIQIATDLASGTVTILDAMGRTVETKTISSDSNTIDVSSLKNGIYYISLTNGNEKSAVRKIVISK